MNFELFDHVIKLSPGWFSESYQGHNPFQEIFEKERSNHVISARMGAGKSTALTTYLLSRPFFNFTKICIIVPRQALATYFESCFNKVGIPVFNYLKDGRKDDGILIVSPKKVPEYIEKIEKCHTIIMDEYWTLLDFLAGSLMNGERIYFIKALNKWLNSKRCIFMDALMCSDKIQTILPFSNNITLWAQDLKERMNVNMYCNWNLWCKLLVDRAMEAKALNKCIFLVSAEKTILKKIDVYLKDNKIDGLKMRIVSADATDQEKRIYFENPNGMVDCDILACTSALSPSVSIDILDKVYHVFCLFNRSINVEVAIQLIRRVREKLTVEILWQGRDSKYRDTTPEVIYKALVDKEEYYKKWWSTLYFEENELKEKIYFFISYVLSVQYKSGNDSKGRFTHWCNILGWTVKDISDKIDRKNKLQLNKKRIKEYSQEKLEAEIDEWGFGIDGPNLKYIKRLYKKIEPEFYDVPVENYRLCNVLKWLTKYSPKEELKNYFILPFYVEEYVMKEITSGKRSLCDSITIEYDVVSVHLIRLVESINLLSGRGDISSITYSNEDVQELCKLLNQRLTLDPQKTIYNILKYVGFPVDSGLILDCEIYSYLRWKYLCQYYEYKLIWPGFIGGDTTKIPQKHSQNLLNYDQLPQPQMPLLHYREDLPLDCQALDEQLRMCQQQ